MKILYCGISSKYIHTMPAGWFLAEFLKSKDIIIDETYHNVNEKYEVILEDILKRDIDMLLLSVYIFNVDTVRRLIDDVKKEKPLLKIVIGGPEADSSIPCDHLIVGEGEMALLNLLTSNNQENVSPIENLDSLPSPYTSLRLESSKNKLIYYESSRGCPFCCTYCMAGLQNDVRYFSLERVKSDLVNIVKSGAKIIKFTDRTFNANTKRTDEILSFILENFSHKDVCFHFEVGGDLFKESTLNILQKMPKALIQMEAGVQTFNEKTLEAVKRVFNKERFLSNISRIIGYGNIHMHLDLIAGLPYEDLESFKSSVNQVISLKPHKLQLGFLKFLKGTPIRENYKASFNPSPPYEIICSPHISENDLAELKGIDFVIDRLYNSGKFYYTLELMQKGYHSPYDMFKAIADYFKENNITKGSSENNLYKALLDMRNEDKIKDYLKFDYLLTNNTRKIPAFLKSPQSAGFRQFLSKTKTDRYILYEEFLYLPLCESKGNHIVCFDYQQKDPVNKHYFFYVTN